MPPEIDIFGKLLEYGVGFAVIGLAWWRAEGRAQRAQDVADARADAIAKLMADQVKTNEAVMTAMALQNAVLDRIEAWMQRTGGGSP